MSSLALAGCVALSKFLKFSVSVICKMEMRRATMSSLLIVVGTKGVHPNKVLRISVLHS